MELSDTAEATEFRAAVRAFLTAHWQLDPAWSLTEQREAEREFRAKAVAAGYLYRGVPRALGGSEQPPDSALAEIIRDEFRRVRAPREVPGAGVALVVPTLLEWGTPEQCAHFVPSTLTGAYRWAQGYSEPGAGSDLASLRTTAVLVDDRWIINGQKVWSTLAHKCRFMFALVRTEPDRPRREGISYLLLDLQQPGVRIRPLQQMTGHSEFCEVFFDDAHAPADWLVGQRGEGWQVSRSTLKHERSSMSGLTWLESMFDGLVRLAKTVERDGRALIVDPAVRTRLASIQGELLALTYSTHRAASMAARGDDAGCFDHMPKLYSTNLAQRMADCAREIVGEDFALRSGGRIDDGAKWAERFMTTIAMAIAGGTSNIQRNIIAERGLGLPRDLVSDATA